MAATEVVEGLRTPDVPAAMSVRFSASTRTGNRNDVMCRDDPIGPDWSTSGGDDVSVRDRLYRLRHG